MLRKIKNKLSKIPKEGIRYRFVRSIFEDEVIKNSKTCTFYWGLMPGTGLAYLLFGIAIIIYTIIVAPIGFFLGYTPRLFFEKFEKSSNEPPNDGGFFYPYRYSPLRGKYKKLVLWQYVIITFFVYMLVKMVSRGTYGAASMSIMSILKYFGQLVSHNRYWISFALAVIIAIYALGRLAFSYRYELGKFWESACPDLEVVENKKN